MSIRVTCPGCHTRFNVSEKFAGKEGPCPKCKKKITIPTKSEEVVIHAPEHTGPKDAAGKSVLKPIARQETILSAVEIVIIASVIVAFFAGAFMMRFMTGGESEFPMFLLYVAAIGVAIPASFAAYSFLRDQELAGFKGKELWIRVAISSVIYALLWFAFPLSQYAFDGYGTGAWICALTAMIVVGGGTGMLSFDFDYIMGVLHYGMYVGICLIGRVIVDIGTLPGMKEQAELEATTHMGTLSRFAINSAEMIFDVFV